MSVKLRFKKLKDGRQSFYLDIYHNGKRSYEFLDIKFDPRDPNSRQQKELAKKIRAEREHQLLNEDYGFVPNIYKRANFIDFFREFVENYKRPGVRKYRYTLEKFIKFIGSDRISFKSITLELCEEFRDYLFNPENGLTGETPYDYFKRFTAVLNNAVREKIIKENPARSIRVKREQGTLKKEVLTIEELSLLSSTPCGNNDVKRAFLFSCLTGLGLAEINKLRWSDIRDGNKLVLTREKTNKPINNPLNQDAIQLLGVQSGKNEKIFELPSDTAVNKNLRNWVKRAGIPKHISFYCARHTYATLLLTHSNTNPKVLADMLGHSSLQYLGKYLNYTDSLKKSSIEELPTIRRKD